MGIVLGKLKRGWQRGERLTRERERWVNKQTKREKNWRRKIRTHRKTKQKNNLK